jgi:uncharacterized membrane protein YedE/YeeE
MIDYANFTPWMSLAGGLMIGAAAGMLWLGNGRIAGISGIFGGIFLGTQDRGWRGAFLAGMVVVALALGVTMPHAFGDRVAPGVWAIVLAGLLVGFGTRLGSGCTSGHGVCGLSRMSARSFVATVTFMATGAVMTFVMTRFLAG